MTHTPAQHSDLDRDQAHYNIPTNNREIVDQSCSTTIDYQQHDDSLKSHATVSENVEALQHSSRKDIQSEADVQGKINLDINSDQKNLQRNASPMADRLRSRSRSKD